MISFIMRLYWISNCHVVFVKVCLPTFDRCRHCQKLIPNINSFFLLLLPFKWQGSPRGALPGNFSLHSTKILCSYLFYLSSSRYLSTSADCIVSAPLQTHVFSRKRRKEWRWNKACKNKRSGMLSCLMYSTFMHFEIFVCIISSILPRLIHRYAFLCK